MPTNLVTKMGEEKRAGKGGDEAWRSLLLGKEVLVKSIHPHVLVQFTTGSETDRGTKQPDPVAPADDDDDEYGDESNWQCNGTVLFKDGCKSGQTDFDEHAGIGGWQSPKRECDFDLCEMCIRWCLHCEKSGADFGWSEQKL